MYVVHRIFGGNFQLPVLFSHGTFLSSVNKIVAAIVLHGIYTFIYITISEILLHPVVSRILPPSRPFRCSHWINFYVTEGVLFMQWHDRWGDTSTSMWNWISAFVYKCVAAIRSSLCGKNGKNWNCINRTWTYGATMAAFWRLNFLRQFLNYHYKILQSLIWH
jgi:hypothetical protein